MDSDIDVSRWVLEFLLRDRDKESIAKRVLAATPLSNHDRRLKKTVLLRTIESEIFDSASVSETLLEALESIEVLDRHGGIPVTDSMRAAYCAVAMECTVKFLVCSRGKKPSGKYMEAVDRIWRGRVRVLEETEGCELVSDELKERRDEVEAGVWDRSVSRRLARMNSRNDALRLVAVYVKEAFAMLGPPFIAWAVRFDMQNNSVGGSKGDKVAAENAGDVSGGCGVEVGSPKSREKETEPGVQSTKEANDVRDGFEQATQTANGANTQVQLENDNNVVRAGRSPLSNTTHGVYSSQPATKEKETPRSTILRRKHGPAKIRDAEDLDTNVSAGKYNPVSSAEFRKVQEELKSSVVALQAVVTDPLPYALRVSETVRSELDVRPVNHVSGEDGGAAYPLVEKNTERDQSDNNGNKITCHQNDVPQLRRKENDAPNPPIVKGRGTEYVQTGNVNPGNPSCSYQNNASRSGLMERNSTAHTYEWNDSLGMSPDRTMNREGLRLHSPKRNVVSPLKKYEDKRFSKRRKIKRWSLHEEDTLRTGVQIYGKGNWKFILAAYKDVFEERTEVDLKDKWRNMTK